MGMIDMVYKELAEKNCAFADKCVGKSEYECKICYDREESSEYYDKGVPC